MLTQTRHDIDMIPWVGLIWLSGVGVPGVTVPGIDLSSFVSSFIFEITFVSSLYGDIPLRTSVLNLSIVHAGLFRSFSLFDDMPVV